MHCISGTSSVASKFEELECLYAAVGKVIYEGLTNYEKATNANPSQLFGKCGIHYESLWDVVLTNHGQYIQDRTDSLPACSSVKEKH